MEQLGNELQNAESQSAEFWILYCRVSSHAQQKEGASLSFQLNAIENYIANNKKQLNSDLNSEPNIIKILEQASAKKMKKQKQFVKCLNEISLMKPIPKTRIFVYHSSRFSRDETIGKSFVEELHKNNIFISSVSENLDSQYQLEQWKDAIQSSIDESKLLSSRIKSGYYEKKRLGGQYESCGLYPQESSNKNLSTINDDNLVLFERYWVDLQTEQGLSIKIPKIRITEQGKYISNLLLKYSTKKFKDAFQQFYKDLNKMNSQIQSSETERYSTNNTSVRELENDELDWDFEIVNNKLKEKQIQKLLHFWNPNIKWTKLLISRLILYSEK